MSFALETLTQVIPFSAWRRRQAHRLVWKWLQRLRVLRCEPVYRQAAIAPSYPTAINGRHRHCCQDCRLGLGHSRRCNKQLRLVLSSSGLGYRVCRTTGCRHSSFGDHDTCCSTCGPSLGTLHARRCRGLHTMGSTVFAGIWHEHAGIRHRVEQ